jgi:hypothetical protein
VEDAAVGHREAPVARALHQRDDLGQRPLGGERQQAGLEAGLEALHLLHDGALILDRLAHGHHPDPAELRDRDRHLGTGHGLHGGTHDGNRQVEAGLRAAAEGARE